MHVAQPQTYNGWANYATWRINLEIVDDYIYNTVYDTDGKETVNRWLKADEFDTARELEDYVTDLLRLEDDTKDYAERFVRSYASSFIADVDWYELAESARRQAKEARDYALKHASV